MDPERINVDEMDFCLTVADCFLNFFSEMDSLFDIVESKVFGSISYVLPKIINIIKSVCEWHGFGYEIVAYRLYNEFIYLNLDYLATWYSILELSYFFNPFHDHSWFV